MDISRRALIIVNAQQAFVHQSGCDSAVAAILALPAKGFDKIVAVGACRAPNHEAFMSCHPKAAVRAVLAGDTIPAAAYEDNCVIGSPGAALLSGVARYADATILHGLDPIETTTSSVTATNDSLHYISRLAAALTCTTASGGTEMVSHAYICGLQLEAAGGVLDTALSLHNEVPGVSISIIEDAVHYLLPPDPTLATLMRSSGIAFRTSDDVVDRAELERRAVTAALKSSAAARRDPLLLGAALGKASLNLFTNVGRVAVGGLSTVGTGVADVGMLVGANVVGHVGTLGTKIGSGMREGLHIFDGIIGGSGTPTAGAAALAVGSDGGSSGGGAFAVPTSSGGQPGTLSSAPSSASLAGGAIGSPGAPAAVVGADGSVVAYAIPRLPSSARPSFTAQHSQSFREAAAAAAASDESSGSSDAVSVAVAAAPGGIVAIAPPLAVVRPPAAMQAASAAAAAAAAAAACGGGGGGAGLSINVHHPAGAAHGGHALHHSHHARRLVDAAGRPVAQYSPTASKGVAPSGRGLLAGQSIPEEPVARGGGASDEGLMTPNPLAATLGFLKSVAAVPISAVGTVATGVGSAVSALGSGGASAVAVSAGAVTRAEDESSRVVQTSFEAEETLRAAIMDDDVAAVQPLLDAHPWLATAQDTDGVTMLNLAASHKASHICAILIRVIAGFSARIRSLRALAAADRIEQMTPLMWAAAHGDDATVAAILTLARRLLPAASPLPSPASPGSSAAGASSSAAGEVEVEDAEATAAWTPGSALEEFITRSNRHGHSALHFAAAAPAARVRGMVGERLWCLMDVQQRARLLHLSQRDEAFNNSAEVAEAVAATARSAAIVNMMRGCFTNDVSFARAMCFLAGPAGWGPVHFAACSGVLGALNFSGAVSEHPGVATVLASGLVRLTKDGYSPLHLAAWSGAPQAVAAVVEALGNLGSGSSVPSLSSMPPAVLAAVNAPLEIDASTSATPLDLAVLRGNKHAARVLLRFGGCCALTAGDRGARQLLFRVALLGDGVAVDRLLCDTRNGVAPDTLLLAFIQRLEQRESCTFSATRWTRPLEQYMYHCSACSQTVCAYCREACHQCAPVMTNIGKAGATAAVAAAAGVAASAAAASAAAAAAASGAPPPPTIAHDEHTLCSEEFSRGCCSCPKVHLPSHPRDIADPLERAALLWRPLPTEIAASVVDRVWQAEVRDVVFAELAMDLQEVHAAIVEATGPLSDALGESDADQLHASAWDGLHLSQRSHTRNVFETIVRAALQLCGQHGYAIAAPRRPEEVVALMRAADTATGSGAGASASSSSRKGGKGKEEPAAPVRKATLSVGILFAGREPGQHQQQSRFLKASAEALSAWRHDRWSASAMAAGWRYNRETNARRRTSARLLPYDLLPSRKREDAYGRLSLAVLDMLEERGLILQSPRAAAAAAAGAAPQQRQDHSAVSPDDPSVQLQRVEFLKARDDFRASALTSVLVATLMSVNNGPAVHEAVMRAFASTALVPRSSTGNEFSATAARDLGSMLHYALLVRKSAHLPELLQQLGTWGKLPVALATRNPLGMTPLLTAAAMGDPHALQRLIQADAVHTDRDTFGFSAEHYAAAFGHCPALELLLRVSARPPARQKTKMARRGQHKTPASAAALTSAASSGDLLASAAAAGDMTPAAPVVADDDDLTDATPAHLRAAGSLAWHLLLRQEEVALPDQNPVTRFSFNCRALDIGHVDRRNGTASSNAAAQRVDAALTLLTPAVWFRRPEVLRSLMAQGFCPFTGAPGAYQRVLMMMRICDLAGQHLQAEAAGYSTSFVAAHATAEEIASTTEVARAACAQAAEQLHKDDPIAAQESSAGAVTAGGQQTAAASSASRASRRIELDAAVGLLHKEQQCLSQVLEVLHTDNRVKAFRSRFAVRVMLLKLLAAGMFFALLAAFTQLSPDYNNGPIAGMRHSLSTQFQSSFGASVTDQTAWSSWIQQHVLWQPSTDTATSSWSRSLLSEEPGPSSPVGQSLAFAQWAGHTAHGRGLQASQSQMAVAGSVVIGSMRVRRFTRGSTHCTEAAMPTAVWSDTGLCLPDDAAEPSRFYELDSDPSFFPPKDLTGPTEGHTIVDLDSGDVAARRTAAGGLLNATDPSTWLTTDTRSASLDFLLYNPSSATFAGVSLFAYFPTFGAAVTKVRTSVARFDNGRFSPSWAFELVVAIVLAAHALSIGQRILRRGRWFLSNAIAVLDLIVVILCSAVIALDVIVRQQISDLHLASAFTSRFYNMWDTIGLLRTETDLVAIILVLLLLRLSKHFRHAPGWGPLLMAIRFTLTHPTVLLFVGVIIAITLAIGVSYHVALSSENYFFASYQQSFHSLFAWIFAQQSQIFGDGSARAMQTFLFFVWAIIAVLLVNLLIGGVTKVYFENAEQLSEKNWQEMTTRGLEKEAWRTSTSLSEWRLRAFLRRCRRQPAVAPGPAARPPPPAKPASKIRDALNMCIPNDPAAPLLSAWEEHLHLLQHVLTSQRPGVVVATATAADVDGDDD